MKKQIVLFIFLFSPTLLLAAKISGHISNTKGQSLPFAAVQIKGTHQGVMADQSGYYQMELPPGHYTLICRYTAYKISEKEVFLSQKGATVDFQLTPEKLQLPEIIINASDEDPAYAIMRQVINHRKIHEKQVKTLETDIYLKGDLHVKNLKNIFGGLIGISVNNQTLNNLGLDSAGNGIIYLLEEHSHYYFQRPNKEFNKVQYVHVSGNPQGLGFAQMPAILNIYENNIDLLSLNSRGFISPANGGAFHYYDFKLLGTFQQYGHTIDKIKVIPRRKYEPLFSGTVYVAEGDWVFQHLDLYVTKTAQIYGVDTLWLKQSFEPYKKGIWVIQNQVLGIKLHLFGVPIKGNFLTVYQNQTVNQPIDKKIFSNKVISTYAKDATQKDSSYWQKNRPVPIKPKEKENFHLRDSVAKVQKAKSDSFYLKPQYRFSITSIAAGDPGITYKNNEWHIRSLVTAIQFNSVEGISGTLGLTWKHHNTDSLHSFYIHWLNRYGFHNHHFNSLIHFGRKSQSPNFQQRYFKWEITAGQYVYQLNRNNPISPIMNEIYTLFGGHNYMKLFENRLSALMLQRDWGNGLYGSLRLSYEQRRQLQNTTQYSFRDKKDNRMTQNLPAGNTFIDKQQAAIAKISLRYRPGARFIQYPKGKQLIFNRNYPTFFFDYTQAFKVGKATADFAKWDFGLHHNVSMNMAGALIYKLKAGGFLRKKEVNFPDYNHVNGNKTFLAAPYLNSFQLAPYYRFSNTANLYGEGHLEWHLDGFLTNKIPGFRTLNWYLETGSNVLYIDKDRYYAEFFVGLNNLGWGLFRFGRIDFIMGYESGYTRPSYGVRVGFSNVFNTLLNTQSSSTNL